MICHWTILEMKIVHVTSCWFTCQKVHVHFSQSFDTSGCVIIEAVHPGYAQEYGMPEHVMLSHIVRMRVADGSALGLHPVTWDSPCRRCMWPGPTVNPFMGYGVWIAGLSSTAPLTPTYNHCITWEFDTIIVAQKIEKQYKPWYTD